MGTVFEKNNTIAVRAYAGDAMTMLAFDLLNESDRKDFVGFTIEFKNETMSGFKPLNNRVSFSPSPKGLSKEEKRQLKYSSVDAPFQKFRWLHVLRNFTKNSEMPFFGKYQYRITPRWFKNDALESLDLAKSVTVEINVAPFEKEGTKIAFTRGFIVSQAYTERFGSNGNIRPFGSDLVFDPKTTKNDIFNKPKLPKNFPTTINPYTYEEQYAWLGFNARKAIMDFIEEVMIDPKKTFDVLAYDFSESTIAKNFIELSKQGRIRMFLDNHDIKKADDDNGEGKSGPEYKKLFADQFDTTNGSTLTRHHFSGLGHCKIFIQKDENNKAIKVLTGSTNFTANGLYINANHILILTQPKALEYYERLFEETIKSSEAKTFRNSPLAQEMNVIDSRFSVGFSPHSNAIAEQILTNVNDKINKAQSSVLFAVMELDSAGSVSQNLKQIHQRDDILTLGITDLKGEKGDIKIKLYEPKSKKGVLINGKKKGEILPPPFEKEPSIGIGHQIHHKFVVIDFNTPNATVFCGSSNLAQGGELKNGDNLLMIQDADIATAFAIEAIRLIDHFQFRNRQALATEKGKSILLKTDNKWYQRYFNPDDLYCLDKKVFINIP